MNKFGIPTEYNGTIYRSKLEAQFAYLFDCLGIEFEYEPQEFSLEGGLGYMPDFHLTELDKWVEVKGNLNEEDIAKINGFEKLTGNKMVIAMITDGQFQIMDIEDNDVTEELFEEFDPAVVAQAMRDTLRYTFEVQKAEVDKVGRLIALKSRHIAKYKNGSFYELEIENERILNRIKLEDGYDKYYIEITVDDDDYYVVTLYNNGAVVGGGVSVAYDKAQNVYGVAGIIFNMAYQLHNNTDDTQYYAIMNKCIDRAIAYATLGRT